MAVWQAAVEPRRLPDPAAAQQLASDLTDLLARAEDQPVDAGRHRQRDRRGRAAAARRFLDQLSAVDARGMDIGVPAAAGMPGHRAAEVVVAGDHAPDIDSLDLLAVLRNSDGEPAVEPGGFDLNVRELADPIVIELEDELCGPGRVGRFLPSRLLDREARCTQIEIGNGLGARRLEPGIGHVNADRAGPPSVAPPPEAPPRLGVE